MATEEESWSSDYSSDEDFTSVDDSGNDEVENGMNNQGALLASFLAQIPPSEANETDKRTKAEKWSDYVQNLASSKVLRLTDQCVLDYGLDLSNTNTGAASLETLFQKVESGIPFITHLILGRDVLSFLRNTKLQSRLMAAVGQRHTQSVVYLKLGSDVSKDELDSSNFIAQVASCSFPNLREVEIWGLQLYNSADVQKLSKLFRGNSLKQLNLMNFSAAVHETRIHLLDPLVSTLAKEAPNLDELRLVLSPQIQNPVKPLVSAACLGELLRSQPKWWRLALEKLGLDNTHAKVLADALQTHIRNVGDLLSLIGNHNVDQESIDLVVKTCKSKGRMGRVQLDDTESVAKLDVVRTLNNLHGRLKFVDGGEFAQKDKFVEWLIKLSNLSSWEGPVQQLTYVWFTLREKPDFVSCS